MDDAVETIGRWNPRLIHIQDSQMIGQDGYYKSFTTDRTDGILREPKGHYIN